MRSLVSSASRSGSRMHNQRPNEACLHPERYSAADVHATEDQVITLIRGFITALQPEYVIETGTYLGHTAKAIGEALRENGHGHLDTIEIDPERAAQAAERCEGLPVTVHATESRKFTPRKPIEFAWIDEIITERNHSLARFRPHFATGAVIAVHDTGSTFRTRERLQRIPWLTFQYLPTFRGVGIAVV